MNCASCGRTNPAGSRFCAGCGTALAPRCAACGAESPADARFCVACGAPLAGAAAPQTVSRKIVTIVFADLIGSVSLHERLDAESARRLMDRYHRAMSAAVDVHGGRVVQLLGDGVLAAFGVPRVGEDDALRAVRAAVGMQRAFRELAREQSAALASVGLRVAVNTGEIVVGDDENSVMGDPTNVAARLQQEARDGDVIVGEGTQRLVGDLLTLAPLGRFALRGRAEAVAAYRVVSLDRPASRQATAFVGRENELRRLSAIYDAAVAAPGARLALLLGSPGLGKSRLVAEFTRRVGERATVLSARCDAAGGATFAPLAEALRALLRIDEGAGGDVLRAAIDAVVPGDNAERTRIADGVGALLAGTPAPPEETFFVVRRLLASLAAVRPVVLVIDDLHWAEPLLLDLVEHLVQWSSGVPLLLLGSARPELRDARSALATPGGLVAEVITLAGLDAGAATRLAANVVGGAELPAALAGRVLATSEGNPLFVSELVRMLVQDGTLQREGERWITTVEVAKLDMPPTIQVLLGARIERLRPEERSVLERAAVIGRQFSRAAVAHLLPRDPSELDARLEALRRSELIEPDTGWFLGEPALRFHHVLIRDAAYRRVLKETRAELHARIADWIVGRVGPAVEHDETVGWHLEQAHQHLCELGPLDENGRSLGERAARHLGAAGRRALARDDLALGAGLLGRALDCLGAEDPARADLALDWCEALLAAGDVGPAAEAIDELGRFSGGSERLRAWHTCFAGQLAALTDPEALRGTADAVAGAALTLASAGDAAGEAKAHFVHASALARLGEIGACEAALDRALAAARRARDRRRANAVLAGAPIAALWGPSPVTRASGRCLDVVRVLRITQGAPAVEAVALRCQAVLEALRGRADAARRMIASSRRMVEELGIAQQLLEADVFAGYIELLEGDAEAAEPILRAAYDGLRERGLGIDAARAAALLGRALLAQDRASEAEALSHESEALAGDDLKAAIAWRGVRAEALARRGESAAAVDLAHAAVALAAATDALLDHADARLSLAAALRAAGRSAEGDAEEARAFALWEAKGATLLAARAGRTRERPAAATPAASPHPLARRRVSANAATLCGERLRAAAAARDIDAISALCADDLQVVHHPTGAWIDREAGLNRFRMLLRAEGLSLSWETLATLGHSLELGHDVTSFDRLSQDDLSFGASRSVNFNVVEVDARGQCRRVEIFAEDRLADAVARLYERFAELATAGPEQERAAATARSVRAVLGTAGDDSAFRAVLSPGLEFADHRQLGLGRARGASPVARGNLVFHEVADRVSSRVDELLASRSDGLVACRTVWGVEREGGGAFEHQHIELWTFGDDGLLAHLEHFDPADARAALARFDDLLAAPPLSRFDNAVSRAQAILERRWRERDWDAVLASFGPEAELDDRRPLVGVRLSGGAFLANLRILFDTGASEWRSELLATRGERLALFRTLFSGALGGGALEDEHLSVVERDAAGRAVAIVVFDARAREAAHAELDARYHAGEAAAFGPAAGSMRAFARAFERRDWEALAALCAPDLVVSDHRRLGWEPLHGPAPYLAALRALVELAPDTRMRLDHVTLAACGYLVVTVWVGTRDGGWFEEPSLMVAELDAAGRVRRFDQYELERLGEARARFEAVRELDAAPAAPVRAAKLPPDPLRIPPNAATRLFERWQRAFAARDWAALEALCARELVYEDRRRMDLISGDRDTFLANSRLLAELAPPRIARTVLATAGTRLALERLLWTSDAGEVENLQVVEVDAEGRLVALIGFDPDDQRAASIEMTERYFRGEGSRFTPASLIAFARASNAHDLAGMRAALSDRYTFHDHRRTGVGRIGNADEYVASHAAMWEMSPDMTTDTLYHVAVAEHASLGVGRMFGTLAEGGAFESLFVRLTGYEDGRLVGTELFELEDLDRARAVFENRRRNPLRVPPNAATRAADRLQEASEAGDWDGFAAACSPSMVFDDRHRRVLLRGDRDLFVASSRMLWSYQTRVSPTLLATAGDRLALRQLHFTGTDGGGPIEADTLSVVEVDAEGRIAAIVAFDPADRRAASAELSERFFRSEAAQGYPAGAAAAIRAIFDRDLEGLRAVLPEDFLLDDRRRTGLGRIEGAAAFVQSLAPLFEQAPDLLIETLYMLALSAHGVLDVAHMLGTLAASGGAFESVYVRLGIFRGDGTAAMELYEVEDLELARARFASLGSDPLRIPPNAATRALPRIEEGFEARDWPALRALASRDFVFEDRRRFALLGGDVELWIRNLEVVREWPGRRTQREPIGALGERIALDRIGYASDSGEGAFEGEFLRLTEVDADGKLRALIHFDPDERPAVFSEGYRRFAAGEASGSEGQAAIAALTRAFAEQDWEGIRGVMTDDAVIWDRRRLRLGAFVGELRRDAWIDSLGVFAELAFALEVESSHVLAWNRRGAVAVARVYGTQQGGGSFENVFISVFATEGEWIRRYELFDVAAVEAALTRFRELCGPPGAPAAPRKSA